MAYCVVSSTCVVFSVAEVVSVLLSSGEVSVVGSNGTSLSASSVFSPDDGGFAFESEPLVPPAKTVVFAFVTYSPFSLVTAFPFVSVSI